MAGPFFFTTKSSSSFHPNPYGRRYQARRSTQHPLLTAPHKSGIGLDLIWTFTVHRVDQSLVSYASFIYFCFILPLSMIEFPLLLWPFHHFGLCTSATLGNHIPSRTLDYDSVHSPLFQALHPLAIVATLISRRQAPIRIWFSHSYPSARLALRFTCPYFNLD